MIHSIKRFSTDRGLRKSVHGAFWRSVQPISLNIISLPVMAYIIRRLGPSGYGSWNTATALIVTSTALTCPGLRGTFIRDVAQHPESGPKFFADQQGVRIPLTLMAAMAAAISCVCLGYDSVIFQCTIVAAIGMLLNSIWSTASDLMDAQQRLQTTAAAAMIAGLVLTAASVVAIWLGWGPVGLSLAYLCGPLASLWFLLRVLHKEHFPIRANFNTRRAAKLIWESRYFTAMQLLATMNGNITMLMLPKLVGVASFGLFSAGVLMLSRLTVLQDAIGTAFYPLIAKSIRTDLRLARRHAMFGIAMALAAGLAVAVPMVLVAGLIARVLFPKQPAGCEHVIALTIWALPLVGIETLMAYALNAAGREAAQARISVWSSIVSLVAGTGFVLAWKLEGACWYMPARSLVQIGFMTPIFLSTFFGKRPVISAPSDGNGDGRAGQETALEPESAAPAFMANAPKEL